MCIFTLSPSTSSSLLSVNCQGKKKVNFSPEETRRRERRRGDSEWKTSGRPFLSRGCEGGGTDSNWLMATSGMTDVCCLCHRGR